MAGAVRILMLLACVPLVQPTGLCVCKAGPRPRAPSHRETATAMPQPRKAACCSRCRVTDEPRAHASADPRPCPPPNDDGHMPGCPASEGVDRAKWSEPVQSLARMSPPAEVGAFLPVEVTAAAVSRPAPALHRLPSPPLYLSHCSFVI